MPLNDTKIKSVNKKAQNGEKVGKISDGINGLYLKDGKCWRLDYKFDGKRKTLALGVYPRISLKEARILAEKAQEQLAHGIDPNEEKKAAKVKQEKAEQEAALTFEVVAREYIEKKTSNLTEKYRKGKIQRIEKHLIPYIGNIPMHKLEFIDLANALKHIHDKKDIAHRIAEIAGQICRYARSMQYIKYDISSGLSETLPNKQEVRHRPAITDKNKVGILLRNIDEYDGLPQVKYALKIMPYVFVRSKELLNAKWSEIDFEKKVWTIPAERMKKRRVHVVPLSRQVISLLQDLRDWTGHADFVFPSAYSNSACISDVTLRNGLLRMGYGRDEMCVHGFRSMASTLLNESGKFRYDVIEAQLAHADKNKVRSAYNHAEYMKERTEMMQAWADMLDEMRNAVK